MPRILLGTLVVIAVLFAPLPADAVPLPPQTTLDHPTYLPGGDNPDYTLDLPGWFTPPNMIATLVSPYVYEPFPPFTGTLTSTVYAEPTTGHLGFEYVWTNTTPPDETLDLVIATVGGEGDPFLGVDIVDAGSDTSGLSTDLGSNPPWFDGSPNALERFSDPDGANIQVQWLVASVGTVIRNPTGAHPLGDTSARIWFITDEKTYRVGTASMQDSGRIAAAQALVPTIPEPATLSLLGLGLLAAARRRRK